MAYFSNGTQGMDYEDKYCFHCIHSKELDFCPCWAAHKLWNHEEAHNQDSILHKMIPMVEFVPQECIFFKRRV